MSGPQQPETGAGHAQGSAGGSLSFATAAVTLPIAMVAARPPLTAAAVEDLCWSIAATDWIRREPTVKDAAGTSTWVVEGSRLKSERARIQGLLFEAMAAW
jgi:hypothetical protein